jgi:sugar phosphate isomerase/epimerase
MMKISRRVMLKAGVISVLTAPFARAAEPSADPYRGLKVGVHSYSLRKFSFADAIKITQSFNVKYMTINPVHLPLDSSAQALADAKKALADAGITPMGCGVVQFSKGETDARQAFEYARALGMPTIIGNPPEEFLDSLDKLAEEYGINVAIHNHGPDSRYKVPTDLLNVLDKHSKRIGACVDIGHYERAGIKAADALKTLSARMYDMHLKDVSAPVKDGKCVLLGTGIIDWPSVAKTLLDLKYAGQVGLEYEIEPESPQASMAKCFAKFAETLAKV